MEVLFFSTLPDDNVEAMVLQLISRQLPLEIDKLDDP